jgi:hypothetical protein
MKKVMKEYLEILFDYVKIKEGQKGATARILSGSEGLKELGLIVDTFWLREMDSVQTEIKNFDGLKSLYWGGLPHDIHSFVKISSLYSDIILIEDPFLRRIPAYLEVFGEKKVSDMVYDIYKIRDWIEDGIVVLFPKITEWNAQSRERIYQMADEDANNEIFKEIALRNRELNLEGGAYVKYMTCSHPKVYQRMETEERKKFVASGAAILLNDALGTSSALNSISTTDTVYGWDLLKYKIEHDNRILKKDALSLAALNKVNIKFLNNVTLDFALKIREEGYVSELRSFFREKFGEIQKAPDKTEFDDVVNNYSVEIADQVKRHEKEWENIGKEAFEKIGVKTGLALATGVIGGAVTYGLTIPAWIGFLGGLLSSSNYTFKDIVTEILEIRKKRRDLHGNAVHLLYELKST